MSEQERLRTYSALTAAMLFWGLSFVATKVALESIPTFTLIFARFTLAAVFFSALMLRNGFPSFSPADHVKLFLMSLFEPGLYFIFETLGLVYTSAPKASLIIASIPVAVMILSSVLLKERTSRLGVAGIFLSLAGIVILVTGGTDISRAFEGSLMGDLLIFGAVVSAALYIVGARNLGLRYSALSITSIQVFYGALFYAPAFLWQFPALSWETVSGRSFAALLYLTIFATVAAFLCYNYSLTKVPASRAAVFINGIPVVTAVGAWLILGETLTAIQAAGGFLVLAGVFTTNLPGLRRDRSVYPPLV
ncbi:MAG: EamA family transporter [Deltaproteobacteria bacterium]|nr:EamA family transporter [Deltaproteobacteria bacterium]